MSKRKPTRAPATDDPPHLQPGSQIEISSNDPGFRGSWYTGVVIKRTPSKKPNNKFVVEYTHLFEDEAGTKPLRETADAVDLRPPAPREKVRKFKFSEEVDAFHNDGWWEGVITKELENGRFHVYFKRSKEQLEFGEDHLRLHREWIEGTWTPPLQEDKQVKESNEAVTEGKMEYDKVVARGKLESDNTGSKKKDDNSASKKKLKPDLAELECDNTASKKKGDNTTSKKKLKSDLAELQCDNTASKKKGDNTKSKKKLKSDLAANGRKFESNKITKYREGECVEVTSDEDGFEGAWFTGTIVKAVGKHRYLVQYDCLRTDDDTDFLKEEFDALHIRPCPPEIFMADAFQKLDEVDAFYLDGWWVGVISKVINSVSETKYEVYFKATQEEMKFKHAELRMHQDWINEKWVTASKV
ncbi:Peroxidase 31, putative isoform 1 [Hibiscus syriacus]|uniref:Peroxidase 31, putative isoform 1 n=1 Tax=Hibiscus syriacus TaxID=106335 RepID=A0A6A3B4B7_HIBSY|nr:Peroxidase 31, putative isoform 1 [Hibiscus syriacus]